MDGQGNPVDLEVRGLVFGTTMPVMYLLLAWEEEYFPMEMTPVHPCTKLLSHVQLFVTPWTVDCQAPLSIGILQVRILEGVAMPSHRGLPQLRDRIFVSYIPCIGRQVLYH